MFMNNWKECTFGIYDEFECLNLNKLFFFFSGPWFVLFSRESFCFVRKETKYQS